MAMTTSNSTSVNPRGAQRREPMCVEHGTDLFRQGVQRFALYLILSQKPPGNSSLSLREFCPGG